MDEIRVNALPEDDNKQVRYLQIGIQNEKGFSGRIYDYVGGGEFQDFFYLHDEDVDSGEESLDYEEQTEVISEVYPWLVDAIWNKVDEITTYDKNTGYYYFKPDFVKKMQRLYNGDFAKGYYDEYMMPVMVGDTIWHVGEC